jgi:hypothetical protein
LEAGAFIYNFGMGVSLGLEGLYRIFRERKAKHIERISDYLAEVAEQFRDDRCAVEEHRNCDMDSTGRSQHDSEEFTNDARFLPSGGLF